MNQQTDELRPLDETLERAWRVLLTLPRSQLSMLSAELLDAHGATENPEETSEETSAQHRAGVAE